MGRVSLSWQSPGLGDFWKEELSAGGLRTSKTSVGGDGEKKHLVSSDWGDRGRQRKGFSATAEAAMLCLHRNEHMCSYPL
jgi:hypothetical protein